MAVDSTLLAAGFVPKGTSPSPLSRFLTDAGGIMDQISEQQKKLLEKRAKDRKDGLDMYKTLRSHGYTPEAAYGAIEKEFPSLSGMLPDASLSTETKGNRDWTQEQGTKRKIGKQHVIEKINQWGKSGQLSNQKGEVIPVTGEDELKNWFIDNKELEPYFDVDDPDISQAISTAVSARTNGEVDLQAEAKKEGKSVVQKFKEFVGKYKTPAAFVAAKVKKTPAAAPTDPQTRFQQLISQGVGELEAYQQLIQEGF